jgi:hypothetical protein
MFVYKYMTAERFQKRMGEYLAGYLWFADFRDFTDPKEGRYKWSSSRLDGKTAQRLKDDLKERKHAYKICSTSMTPDNFRLWSIYADNFKGVCLKIKVCHQYQEISQTNGLYTVPDKFEIMYGNIEYHKNLKCYENINGNTDEKALTVLMTKLKIWIGEKEKRFITDSETRGMFSVGEVQQVILGANFERIDIYEELKEYFYEDKIFYQQYDLQSLGFTLKGGKQ